MKLELASCRESTNIKTHKILIELRAVGVLFSPVVSGWAGVWAGGRQEKVCPGCISETVRCMKLILGRDKVTTARSNVKSRSHQDIAHLNP